MLSSPLKIWTIIAYGWAIIINFPILLAIISVCLYIIIAPIAVIATPFLIGFISIRIINSVESKLRELLAFSINNTIRGEPVLKNGNLYTIYRLDKTEYIDRWIIWLKLYRLKGYWVFLKFELEGRCITSNGIVNVLCEQQNYVQQKNNERDYLKRVGEAIDKSDTNEEKLQQLKRKQTDILREIVKILQNKSKNELIGALYDRALRLERRIEDQLKEINLSIYNSTVRRKNILEYISIPSVLRGGGDGGLEGFNEHRDLENHNQLDQIIIESYLIEKAYEEIDNFK